MTAFLWNLLLAFVWAAAGGEISLGSVVVGFGVGYAVLFVCRRVFVDDSYFARLPRVAGFGLFVAREIVWASLRISFDVLTPRHRSRPGVVAIPLDAETDAEITLLANVVSLTPGTLTLDVSDDRKTLYVHAMFIDDAEALRREIKEGFETRVLELLR